MAKKTGEQMNAVSFLEIIIESLACVKEKLSMEICVRVRITGSTNL